jgi:two-component system sensor histidine kinase VicK
MTDYYALFRPLLARGRAVYFIYHLAEQRVVYISETFEQLTGDPADHVNEDLPFWLKRIHPDDRRHVEQCLEKAAPEEVLEGLELRLTRTDGGTQWLGLTLSRTLDADGLAYLTGSVLDITKQKEVQLNLQKFGTKKNAVLEILSHDLAGPLMMMQQLTEQLEYEVKEHGHGELAEPTQKILHMMRRTCRDSISLIHDFVDAEFMESANVELNLERTDLVAWIGLLMGEYQRNETLMHLQFDFEVPDEPVYIPLDVDKFHQVVNNLLSNAIKFTPDGGRITARIEPHDDRVLVSVRDTGIGIPEKLQPLLFDKFTKARRPGLRGEKTTGLGMSVIRTIVELHHGRVTFSSTEGQGSNFVIELPTLIA